jgi:hypothetical protein
MLKTRAERHISTQEVFTMDINSQDRDDAQQILEAMRQIQENPELKADAETQPESVLDRLGLAGVARHAVALAIAAAVVAPAASDGGSAFFQGVWV